ncbi:MAG: YfiR family protein [Terriglobia bacterium]
MAILRAVGDTVKYEMRILGCRLQIGRVLGLEIVIALWVGASCTTGALAQSREASEYQVKAAFLYNFAKFVEWPPDPSSDLSDPITICVIGHDPFGTVLDEAVRGKTVSGHRLVIRRSKPGQSWTGCQIAFISSAEGKDLPSILESSKGSGVLTVGEMEGFAQRGGMINFVIEQERVHFEVNVEAAERAGLKISSKLLSLAKIVREQDHGKKT